MKYYQLNEKWNKVKDEIDYYEGDTKSEVERHDIAYIILKDLVIEIEEAHKRNKKSIPPLLNLNDKGYWYIEGKGLIEEE